MPDFIATKPTEIFWEELMSIQATNPNLPYKSAVDAALTKVLEREYNKIIDITKGLSDPLEVDYIKFQVEALIKEL